MIALGAALQSLAGAIDVWRGPAIMLLVGVVIGCFWLYASLVGES